MKKVLCRLGIFLLLSLSTGCQAAPWMAGSRLASGHFLPDHVLDGDLASSDMGAEQVAYQQSLPEPAKKVNPIPSRRIPLLSRPLGYRRGYQPCNT